MTGGIRLTGNDGGSGAHISPYLGSTHAWCIASPVDGITGDGPRRCAATGRVAFRLTGDRRATARRAAVIAAHGIADDGRLGIVGGWWRVCLWNCGHYAVTSIFRGRPGPRRTVGSAMTSAASGM